jgi:WhiB family redox-sensing transcriptional regulator
MEIDTDLDLSWLTDRPHWEQSALCAQTDPELFYPEKGSSPRRAKAICANCKVVAECLADALDRNDLFGVHGGTTARERRGMLATPKIGDAA